MHREQGQTVKSKHGAQEEGLEQRVKEGMGLFSFRVFQFFQYSYNENTFIFNFLTEAWLTYCCHPCSDTCITESLRCSI